MAENVMAEQQEMFEYSPPPEQAQLTNDRPANQPENGREPIKIELDASEQYQIGNQVVSGQELIDGGVGSSGVAADDSRWNEVETLRQEVSRLQGHLESTQQSKEEMEPSLQDTNEPSNRVSEVFSNALEQDRTIDHEYLVDLFSANAADRDAQMTHSRGSQESVSATEAILDRRLTSLGEEQIAQQTKHQSANKVFEEFVDNKASNTGASKESIIEDYREIADEVLNDPSLLTMQSPEDAGSLMQRRLQSVDKIIEKRSGNNGTVQKTTQQNQAQLNSGNGKVYTPRRSNDTFKLPEYPAEERARYNFNQKVKQGERVIG